MNRLDKIKAQKLKNLSEKQDDKVAPIQDDKIKVKTPRREYTLSVGDITANEALEKVKEEYPNFKEFEYKTITYKKTGKKGEFIKRVDPPEKIEQRWQKKKDHIRELSDNISRLKNRITRDLKSDKEKEFLTALIIAIILRIGERIGNEDSANYQKVSTDDKRKKAYGVSGFKKTHVDIIGNKVHLTYIGKKGVPQDKSFSDEKIAKALKTAIKKSPSAFIFTTSTGQKIGANQVNDYLRDFNITAKGIRGYYCNRGVLDKLKDTTPEDSDKKRKKQLNIILKNVSAKVGHGCSVLKNQYLMPEVITYWVDKGEVFDIKEAGYVMKEGGEIPNDNKNIIKKETGGKTSENEDFANSDKNRIFTPINPTKDEISEIISGTRSVTSGRAIQQAANYLRRSESESSMDRSSHLQRQDEVTLREYISTNNLWIPIPNPKNYFAGGGEAKVYLYGDYVIKINCGRFYQSWQDYFNNLLLNNLFFPATSYELIGFTEDNGKLCAAVKQEYVPPTSITNLMDIRRTMSDLGFNYSGGKHYTNPTLGIELKDLHEGNVLTKDDVLYFIDTIFFLNEDVYKRKRGGKVDDDFLENLGNISYEQFKDIQKRSPHISFEDNNRAGAYVLLRQRSTTLEEKRAQVLIVSFMGDKNREDHEIKRHLKLWFPDSTEEEKEKDFNEIKNIISKENKYILTIRQVARYLERKKGITEKDSEMIEEDYSVYFSQGQLLYIWNFWREDFDRLKNEHFDSNDMLKMDSEWLSDKKSADKIMEEKEKLPFYKGRLSVSRQKMEAGGEVSGYYSFKNPFGSFTSVKIMPLDENLRTSTEFFTTEIKVRRKEGENISIQTKYKTFPISEYESYIKDLKERSGEKKENGGITDEDIISRYNLTGKTSVPIRFKDDNKTYFTKKLSLDRKFIFVLDGSGKSHGKKITEIVHINGRDIVFEKGGYANKKSSEHHAQGEYIKNMEHGGIGETMSLAPMIRINMDNYGTNDVKELDKRAEEYLKGLRGVEFSLEESNPNIKFTLSTESVWHLINRAGFAKIKITKQLPEIFKQGIVFKVEDETKGDTNVLHVLRCGTYIMVNGEVYVYYFVLKLKIGNKNYIHDGNIDMRKPEKEKTT